MYEKPDLWISFFLIFVCCLSLCLLVDECVRLVSKSVKPVIIIGSQATLPPVPVDKLKEALEVRKQSFQVAVCRIILHIGQCV